VEVCRGPLHAQPQQQRQDSRLSQSRNTAQAPAAGGYPASQTASSLRAAREITNNCYIDLHERQQKIHTGYLQALQPLLNKKFLTPVELRKLQLLLLKMRQVCNSTYLTDRKTHISPKMKELEGLLDELVSKNGHKVVIFSEWATMTMLIGKHLSLAAIPFVELSGKIPVNKRQALIDEFNNNPACKVFLSTDAGGTGFNLQAADCVINFELPWNPARLNQRIGRVSRIGQQNSCINLVNLIARNSLEEKIFENPIDESIIHCRMRRSRAARIPEKIDAAISSVTSGGSCLPTLSMTVST
jgi:SNF2 family DNA or RNA helicase